VLGYCLFLVRSKCFLITKLSCGCDGGFLAVPNYTLCCFAGFPDSRIYPIRILAGTLAIPIEFFHNFTQLMEASAGLV
jgi:hypothetical protein